MSPHDLDDDNEDVDRDIVMHGHSISSEVASRIPSFLAHVSKLRSTFVGGPTGQMRKYGYHHRYCIEPRNHKAIFRGLLEGCVAAFKNEAFPSTLSRLNGISDNVKEVSRGRCVSIDPFGCTICRDLCVHFPIADVISLLVCEPNATCLNTTEMLDAVRSRKGGKTILAENSADILLRLVNPLKLNFVVGATEVTVDFTKRMKDLCVWPVPVSPDVDLKAISIKKVPNYTCEKLSEVIKYGFDPRSLSRDQLLQKMLSNTNEGGIIGNRHGHVWAKASLERLIALGFDLSLEDDAFVIVDEKTEPALRGLSLDF